MSAKPQRMTKQKRLVAIVDLYTDIFNKHDGVTMDEVAGWALANHLYPTPGVRDAEAVCREWDERFAALKAKHCTEASP
jgi:hypothetical protein